MMNNYKKSNNNKKVDNKQSNKNSNNNSFNNNNNINKNSKNNYYTFKPQNQFKTLYPFIKGIPPSSNWSNHFTSTLFSNGKYLLYISNSFIVVLNLEKKIFSQILSSNKITQKDKPNIIVELNNEKFLTITSNGDMIIFYIKEENTFIEDLSTNKLNKVIKKVKCGIYNKEQKLLILSNEEKIYLYSFEFEKGLNIYKLYEIDNCNNYEYIITDMLLINNENLENNNSYLVVSNNMGNVILYTYDSVKYTQIFVIKNNKKENIFNICYDNVNNLLCSINKSGTLNFYKINFDININGKIEYNNILTLNNKFNDQSINEFFLYFSISFIYNEQNNNNFILVTSNQGRIFIYDIKNNYFKEIAENPHKNSIYTILSNNKFNQVLFFSSDYKISLFNILFSEIPSLNFMYCINTIPSKAKILEQQNNKIYFLYQIQHMLYINSYNFKKDKNYLDTLQNKISLYSNKNNINNDNRVNNYNIHLCKLIDEERILLVNKKNEIIIYNFENDAKENKLCFLNDDYLINDIIINEDILYILYKQGLIVIYNLYNNKIEKYKISNSLDKGCLFHIQNGIIILIIKEEKINSLKFFLLKNYFYFKLYEINIENDYISDKLIFPNDNFYYFYSNDNNFNIIYMNITKQLEILNNIASYKDINYQAYIKIMNDCNNSVNYLNKKLYIFNEIFSRNDVNKNNFKMTNLVINEQNNNMICSFTDGSIMFYIIDIDQKEKYNHTIKGIIYKYLIKAHFLSIINSIFLNSTNTSKNNGDINSTLIASTSSEQSIKIIDITNCNILNIYFEPKEDEDTSNQIDNNNIINENNMNNNYVINKSFTNLFSNYFFTQSYKDAIKFSDNFILSEDLDNCSIEQLIFSYFVNDKEKNMTTIRKVIEYSLEKNKNKKQHSLYIEKICNYFLGKENNKNNEYQLIFEIEINNDKIINILVNGLCFVESLLYIKHMSLGIETFIQCLEKIKKSLYTKQLFQVTKIEKIIQYYKNNFNLINK